MAEQIKYRTDSKEATQFETDPDYITTGIVNENGIKYAIFEKVGKPAEKSKTKEKEGK